MPKQPPCCAVCKASLSNFVRVHRKLSVSPLSEGVSVRVGICKRHIYNLHMHIIHACVCVKQDRYNPPTLSLGNLPVTERLGEGTIFSIRTVIYYKCPLHIRHECAGCSSFLHAPSLPSATVL